MEWLNLHIPILRAPEYIGSDPTARATWLNVLAYCCEQENGGKIAGGASWKDRQWQQTCGVMLEEVRASHPLLSIIGDDVLVWKYPSDKEEQVQHLRALGKIKSERKAQAARSNGSKGGRPKETTQHETQRKTEHETQREETQQTQRKPIEGKGREGNGMEEEEKGITTEEFVSSWNSLPKPFPRIQVMSADRKKSLKARNADAFWLKNWREALSLLPSIPFMRGDGPQGWVADVEFFLRPDSVLKIMEGKYLEKKPATKAEQKAQLELDGYTMVDPLAP